MNVFYHCIGACTNRIEGEWAVLKMKIKLMRGVHGVENLYYLLAHHQWLRWDAQDYPGGPMCCALKLIRL